MAGDSVVGALRVVLGMDTASFEDGAKRASKQLDTFGKRVGAFTAGNLLANAIEKAAGAMVDFAKASLETIDTLGKTAQKVGVSVEAFSALNYAADLADVSTEQLSTGLGKLAKNMADTAAGTGDAAKTFDALGISVKNADGSLRPVDDVLADIADKFQGATDGAQKTAAAMALFGKSGKDLIPLLNDGSTGLREMAAQAEAMGLVISKDTF